MRQGTEPHYEHHPMEDIEPEKESTPYREAARAQVRIMNRALDFILQAENKATASWQVAFALGLACCDGRKMAEVARFLGVGRACISKGARDFCEANGLEPSFYMKTEEATLSYKRTRESQLQ